MHALSEPVFGYHPYRKLLDDLRESVYTRVHMITHDTRPLRNRMGQALPVTQPYVLFDERDCWCFYASVNAQYRDHGCWVLECGGNSTCRSSSWHISTPCRRRYQTTCPSTETTHRKITRLLPEFCFGARCPGILASP